MKVWVTGGSGMVGSAVLRALSATETPVEVLAPRSSELDLTVAEAVRLFLESHRPDTVIHAAGRVGGIAANVADPVRFLTDNMAMGMNVIQSASELGVLRLVNVGSSCMYPRDHEEPLVEDDVLTGQLEPTNEGYAIAKIAADRLCAYVSETTGLHYRTVVPSNLYGPGDHFDELRGHLIANAMRKVELAVRTGAHAVEVWGDGTARREFTFVDDVANWIARVVVDGIDQLPTRLNIGVGIDYTVREYYEHIGRACGYEGEFQFDVSKPVGMKRKLMDSSVAAGFGWVAPTSLDEGLARTLDYFQALDGKS
jgi:GDP-L-fucose synthase